MTISFAMLLMHIKE